MLMSPSRMVQHLGLEIKRWEVRARRNTIRISSGIVFIASLSQTGQRSTVITGIATFMRWPSQECYISSVSTPDNADASSSYAQNPTFHFNKSSSHVHKRMFQFGPTRPGFVMDLVGVGTWSLADLPLSRTWLRSWLRRDICSPRLTPGERVGEREWAYWRLVGPTHARGSGVLS